MTDTEMRQAVREMMAGYEAMRLKRAGVCLPGITDSALVAEVERLDAFRNVFTARPAPPWRVDQ